jgi:hypothetical protein
MTLNSLCKQFAEVARELRSERWKWFLMQGTMSMREPRKEKGDRDMKGERREGIDRNYI